MNILKTSALLALGAIAMQASAQSVVLKLKDETAKIIPADQFEYIQFVEEAPFDENNLLQEAFIPDPVLRQWIMDNVTNGVDYLTADEAAAFTRSLWFEQAKGLVSLEGLQYFSGASQLDINCLTTIDPSTIPVMENITYLNAMSCEMGNFDPIAHFPNVRNLIISNNAIEGELVIASDNIIRLDCGMNANMTRLDLSRCPNIKQVLCTRCGLESINTGTAELSNLYAFDNKPLTSIDLSYCKESLYELTLGNTSISSLDLTGFKELTYLEINDMLLSAMPDISACHNLETLRCENNGFTSLDLTGLRNLSDLYCYGNQIEALDLTPCPYIRQVMAWDNKFKTVDTTACEALGRLCVSGNELSRLDISTNVYMYYLECYDNPDLKEIKVWSTFNIDDPDYEMTNYIQEGAKFVYEFSE